MIGLILKYMLMIVAAYLLADFIAGVYHWIKDTYFSPYTPIIGKTYIWGSRLHHVRPRYVLEFSNWDLFKNSALWTSFWVIPAMIIFGPSVFMLTLFFVISMNDVVHKCSHMLVDERPKWATILQKLYIFQGHDEHHLHHTHPHEINYCPITPYVNVVLEKINFWRTIEGLLEKSFGLIPRKCEDDYTEDDQYPAGIKFLPCIVTEI